jgi:hypothetical protein
LDILHQSDPTTSRCTRSWDGRASLLEGGFVVEITEPETPTSIYVRGKMPK